MAGIGFVAQIGERAHFPFPRTDIPYGLCYGYAKSGVAIEDGEADLNFCDLPIKVSCHQGLAKKLDAVHLGLDAAPAVVSAPSSPDGLPQISRGIDGLVPSDGLDAGGLPRLGVLARGYNGMSAARGNCVVAFAGVIGTIGSD